MVLKRTDAYRFIRYAAAGLLGQAPLQDIITACQQSLTISVEDAEHEVFVHQLKREVIADGSFPSLLEVL